MIEKQILEKLINEKNSFAKIAKILNVNVKTVSRYAKEYNLKSINSRKHFLNENFFEVIDTEEKAYWLGFIAADGCVYKDGKYYRFQINLKGDDINHLEKFNNSLNSDYPIITKTVGKSNSSVCQLKINSNKMCNDLINLNIIPKKSLNFIPPDMPEELIPHFIRGYFDGDGCITSSLRKNNKTYQTKFEIVGGEDALIYIKNNIPVELSLYTLKRNTNIKSLETGSIKKIPYIYDYLYKDATIYLDRKKEKFENILSRLEEIQGQ